MEGGGVAPLSWRWPGGKLYRTIIFFRIFLKWTKTTELLFLAGGSSIRGSFRMTGAVLLLLLIIITKKKNCTTAVYC